MKQIYLKIFFVIAMLLQCSVDSYGVRRGDIDVTVLDVVSGLSSNKINSVVQDEIGYLWFATENGLCRYDGFDFKVYKPSEIGRGVNYSNNIFRVVACGDGNLWLATQGELILFNPFTSTIEKSIELSIFSGQIKDMLMKRGGNILYLATTNGLYSLEGGSAPLRLSDGYVFSLFEDREGFLWVGEWKGDFFRLNPTTGEIFQYQNFFHHEPISVSGFTQDRKGRIWVSTWNSYGVLRLDDPYNTSRDNVKLFPVVKKSGHIQNDVIYDIEYMADKDEIWLGLGDNLLVLSDLEKVDGFVQIEGDEFQRREIYKIFRDRSGAVWVSSLGFGVNKLVRYNDYFAPPADIVDKFDKKIVTSLYEDSEGIIWVGSRLEILSLWDREKGTLTSFRNIEGLSELTPRSNAVLDVYETKPGGDVWLATRYDGVFVLKPGHGKPARLERLRDSRLDPTTVFSIEKYKDGKVLLATSIGLFEANPSSKELGYGIKRIYNDVINGDEVRTISVEASGGMWLGTRSKGIFYVDQNGECSRYTTANDKINENQVLCLYRDSRGELWVGTQGGGISKYDKKSDRFESLNKFSSVATASVTSITEDYVSGSLWFGTDRGLACLILEEGEPSLSVYTPSDGLVNFQYSDDAVLQLSSTEMLFGGYSGIDMFKPQTTKALAPRAVISDLTVRGQSIKSLIDRGELCCEDVDIMKHRVTLNYDQNFVSISFSAISYVSSHLSRFSYRMVGLDNSWNYVGNKNHQVTYGNMPAGTYRFEVRASQQNSEWSEPMYMDIKILPHWSLRWWAFLIYIVLGVLVIIITLILVRREIMLRHSLKIERIERQKSAEVNQIKLQFFSNISHELFTPLSVLQYSVDSFKGVDGINPHTLNVLESNLTRLKRLFRQLMEFRKAENKNLKLLVSNGDIVCFVRNLCECNFKPLFEAKDIRLNFSAEDDVMEGYFDTDKVDKMLYNLISNALKYNVKGGYVSISLRWGMLSGVRCFVLTVTNSGEGIAEERIPHIFQRFYEGDYRRFKTTGTGIGLSLTRDLVVLHEGDIKVESVVGESTTFTVMLPCVSDVYSEEMIDNRPVLDEDKVCKTAANGAQEAATSAVSSQNDAVVENDMSAEDEDYHGDMDDDIPTERVILLVEDDTDILYLLSGLFSRYFRVLTATNGKEALDLLEKDENIDVVVVDNIMPVMDGCEMVRRMRTIEAFESMPIVMLSAKREVANKLEGLRSGVDAYLSKPLEFELLLAQVNVLLERKSKIFKKYISAEHIQSVSEDCQLKLDNGSISGGEDGEHNEDISSSDQVFLDRLISAVESRMQDENFGAGELSEVMNMAQATLYRKLKGLVGVSIAEFIRDLRLKRACELLQDPLYRINDVAYMVGFSDPKYFSKVFKKVKGVTPVNFQKIGR